MLACLPSVPHVTKHSLVYHPWSSLHSVQLALRFPSLPVWVACSDLGPGRRLSSHSLVRLDPLGWGSAFLPLFGLPSASHFEVQARASDPSDRSP